MENVGEKLLALRRRKGLTSYELARKAGLSQSSIVFIENNKRQPSGDTLLKLAKALEIQPNYLSKKGNFIAKEEIKKYLKQNYKKMTDKEMARYLGASGTIVSGYLSRMYKRNELIPRSGEKRKLTLNQRERLREKMVWTKENTKELIKFFNKGMSDKEISNLLFNSPDKARKIRGKRKRMGLSKFHYWEDWEIAILKKYYSKLPFSVLAKVLKIQKIERIERKLARFLYKKDKIQPFRAHRSQPSEEDLKFAEEREEIYGVYALNEEMLDTVLLSLYKDKEIFQELIRESLRKIEQKGINQAYQKIVKLAQIVPERIKSFFEEMPEELKNNFFSTDGGKVIKNLLAKI